VASFLEDRIYHRERLRPASVRLLLNTYLVTSNTEGILALEAFATKKKPDIVPRFSLSFGIPHLLAKDASNPERFFSTLLAVPRVSDRDWVSWNHAFSLLQLKRGEEAQKELAGLVETVTEPVLLLLALYLLDVVARTDAGLEARVAEKRDALRSKHTPATFQKAIEKSGGNMQIVVLSRLLQDAVQWLFAGPDPAAPKS